MTKMKQTITYKTAIVIFLVFLITVSLAACLGGNKDDTEGVESMATLSSENIDSKLVGQWQHSGSDFFYDYFFYADGSFEYSRRLGSGGGSADGKYRTSDGKVYFSELNDINAIGERTPYADIVFEYEFGSDDMGEYLLICHFNYLGENRTISDGMKFRRQ